MVATKWPEAVAAQGITIKWGTTEIIATSVSYNRQAQGEIDITSMESAVLTDKDNTNRRTVKKSIEFAVVDHGELNVEFVGPGGFNDTHIGLKKKIAITASGTGFSISGSGERTTLGSPAENFPNDKYAFLTAISVQASAGELVRGNCTFRLSDT